MLLALLIGFFVGMGAVLQFMRTPPSPEEQRKNAEKAEEERARNDPANWWKYGGDPHEKSNYDEDEDN
jgi:hypothetical protein